jgi:hypothetical protein
MMGMRHAVTDYFVSSERECTSFLSTGLLDVLPSFVCCVKGSSEFTCIDEARCLEN